MNLYECRRCRTRFHSASLPQLCEHCGHNKIIGLTKICLMIPHETEPTFPVVHTSGSIVSDDGGVQSNIGQKWAIACKSPIKPPVSTASPSAVTCKRCLDWLESKRVALSPPEDSGVSGEPKLDQSTELANTTLEMEGFDEED